MSRVPVGCPECFKPCHLCSCPAGVTYTQERTAMSFDDQLARILPYVDDQHQFLAGVRFVQGFKEHGDSLMRMTDAELEMARLEEYADAVVYAAEQAARSRSGRVVTGFKDAKFNGKWL